MSIIVTICVTVPRLSGPLYVYGSISMIERFSHCEYIRLSRTRRFSPVLLVQGLLRYRSKVALPQVPFLFPAPTRLEMGHLWIAGLVLRPS